ncbi:hypothetical protein [Streptomyces sp. NBC_00620]|uniref:hypothetical protein n=1 Tax=Streptomyces sp. NBC_00620 TaxID=2903666 RepID=UPI00225031C0|nr:hypothetical protein [Streptomyces sp. NBC_00620]MCX4977308.1 hypothetical protein [Streptomyces sp. NBC_00620]
MTLKESAAKTAANGQAEITIQKENPGTVYRWRLRGRPTYFHVLAWSPCTFAVEHADTPGMTLVVTTDQPHTGNWFGREAEPVLPSGAAVAVRIALREGWAPTALGSAFHLDQSAGFTPSN